MIFFIIINFLRMCHSAQDCARNKIHINLRGWPSMLDRIGKNCPKFAGSHRHPKSSLITLHANIEIEQAKDMCAASSGAQQRAHMPV
jgi:hypothetical protein